ncbi:MAG: hypothetical protein QOF33_1778 [Thermomicrobiales bacterium]|jgi:hypothetical protein|nr:hypothetical protein [Thermomicrobiales bacterium]
MNRTFVNSSNLLSVGYDPNQRILEVAFKNGRVYHYFGVPQSVYEGLMNASSHGKYLNDFIKPFYSYQNAG